MATATESATDVQLVSLAEIRIDGGTQCRLELSEATVEEYSELLVGDFAFPPALVYFDGSTYWMADGFHRFFAYKRTHHDEMPCVVLQGSREDAQWESCGSNKAHGLRRSNADKQRAVVLALAHPNAANLSNGVIASHVGVDEGTIRNYRKKAESTPEFPELNGRQGRDGKVRSKSGAASGGRKPSNSGASTTGEREPANSGTSGVEPEETREELESAAESEATVGDAPLKDSVGNDVPEQYRNVFEACGQFDAIARRLDSVRHEIEALAEAPGGFYLKKDVASLSRQLRNIKGQFAYAAPHAVMLQKKNEPKWVSHYAYGQMAESEK